MNPLSAVSASAYAQAVYKNQTQSSISASLMKSVNSEAATMVAKLLAPLSLPQVQQGRVDIRA